MKAVSAHLILLILLGVPALAHAEKFDEAFFRENLLKKNYAIDTEADAVILFEKMTVHVNPHAGGYNMEYNLHRIIKIQKTAGQQLGNIKTVYINNERNSSSIKYVQGTTYNLSGDSITEAGLDKSAYYDKKISKHHHELAFAMPSVKEGSIVEYEMDIVTPLFLDMPEWEFQGKLPKLTSEYEIYSSPQLQYSAVIQGIKEFTKYSSARKAEKEGATSYTVTSAGIENQYVVLWCRKNIPALKEEPFISDIENYRELFQLQISGHNYSDVISTWKQFNEDLWYDEYFGEQIKKANNFLNTVTDSLSRPDKSTEYAKARNIFNFVRCNFDCNDHSRVDASQSMEKTYENKRGSDADINLLLVAMLRKAGLEAQPVVLSKTGHLKVYPEYPFVDRFNYVVCVVKADGKLYYLDATDKYNRFGVLPHNCYNGYARIVDKEGSAVLITPNDLTDINFTKVNISRITDTTMVIEVMERKGAMSGLAMRKDIGKDNDYLKNFVTKRTEDIDGSVSVVSVTTANLDNPEKDLEIKYVLKLRRKDSDKTWYLGTDMMKFFKGNPFKSAQRKLPIEFRNKYDYTYLMDVLLPADIVPDELPKPITNKTDGNHLSFDHRVSYDSASHMLSVNAKFEVNETVYPVASYEHVSSFFEQMAKEENAMIVLKKK